MRLFVALPVPERTAGEISALQDALGCGRAVDEENLHLTLAFLGDVMERDLPGLDEALAALPSRAVRVEPAGLDLMAGAGQGSAGKRSEALVLRVRNDPALEALAHAVETAARRAGLDLPRRRFRPHITITRFGARLAEGEASRLGRFLAARADSVLTPFEVQGFVLFRSHLRAQGPLYEALAEYPEP